jgi:hypothetical protein
LSILTIETRKDSAVHVSLSSSSLVKQPGSEDPASIPGSSLTAPTRTTNNNRWLSAVDSLNLVRSFTGAPTCLGKGQNSAALSGRFIVPPSDACQRPSSTNCCTGENNSAARKTPVPKGYTPYLSHIPATFSPRNRS